MCSASRQVSAASATAELSSMKQSARNFGVIGIDEGQFVSFYTCIQDFFYH